MPQVLDKANLKKETVQLVTDGLWAVVNSPGGTAYSLHTPGMEWAGKSGTVQLVTQKADKMYGKSACTSLPFIHRHNGLFVAYAPIKDPTIVVAIVSEHDCGGGSHGAGPVAAEVIRTYLKKYYPDLYSDKAIAERKELEKAAMKNVKIERTSGGDE
jgi:penicillin-binding protein 2